MQAGDPPRLDLTVVRLAFRVRREQEAGPVVVRHEGQVLFPIPLPGLLNGPELASGDDFC